MSHFDFLLTHYSTQPTYTYDEALEASIEYFNGDDLAGQKFLDKYALRNEKNELLEKTPTDMHWRIANEFARIEKDKFEQPLTAQEIFDLLDHFKYIVPQGSPMYGIGNPFQYISLSNCFVIDSPVDSYAGIMKTDEQLVQISKRRGGVGTDLSNLRPENSPTKNAAKTSTGVVSFAKRYSNSIREVGQNGRRGALMLTLSVLHPSVMAFIKAKSDLGEITGANISVRLYDEFLNAVENNTTYKQRFPVNSPNPIIQYDVDANTIWDEIIYNAWKNAEPGLQFWDNILKESVSDCYAKYGFMTICSNPCFAGDTLIPVIDKGLVRISDLVDHYVDIYDGNGEKVQVQFRKTGQNQPLLSVELSDGSIYKVTPTHKFLVNGSKIEAKNLKNGMVLDSLGLLDGHHGQNHEPEWAWAQAWYMADGCINSGTIRLYEHKQKYAPEFEKLGFKIKKESSHRQEWSLVSGKSGYFIRDKNRIPDRILQSDLETKLSFIKGMIESDGHLGKTNKGFILQICSIRREFLEDLQQLLYTIGAYSKISLMRPAGRCEFPEGKFYNTKDCWRLTVTNPAKVIEYLYPELLTRGPYNLSKEIQVVSVDDLGATEDVYCCSVPTTESFRLCRFTTGNCSEIFMNANDSCRLLLLNLFSYVINPFTKNSSFDFDLFYQHSQIAQRLMDDMVDLELEMVDRIIEKINNDPEPIDIKDRELALWSNIKDVAQKGRRTGTGITALGDTIAALNIGYGTDQSISVVDNIYKTLKLGCYRSSVDMAKQLGPFPIWEHELEMHNPFLLRIKDQDISLWEDMKKYGRRNIALLTTAPTGTVSIMTQTSGGIEPEFSIVPYTRRIKGNPGDKKFRSDFVDQNGDHWMEFTVVKPKLKLWMEITGETDYTKSPWHGYCANDIDWVKRVELQSIAQKHVDHSISSTVNLPNSATVEDVKNVYMAAWKLGCKGITVYRDGCRTGVLVHKQDQKNNTEILDSKPPKRPKKIDAEVYHTTYKGQPYFVMVGMLNNKPYEVFAGKNGFIDKSIDKCVIEKVKRGHYKTILDNGDTIENIAEYITDEEAAITRLISLSLRHGANIKYCVTTLQKVPGDMHNFAKVLSRILKKYIPDNTEMTGFGDGGTYIFQEGCIKRLEDGWTLCM